MSNKEDLILEEYKLYVGTAEKVSDRRHSTNSYFLTINSVVLGLSGYFIASGMKAMYIAIPVIGLLISILWFEMICNYRRLNKAKFDVIHEIEKRLPISLFKMEQDILERSKYRKLSKIENCVPLVFLIFYLAILAFTLSAYIKL